MIFVQPHMQQQEELAALLSRNLNLDPAVAPKECEGEGQIVYISQHYTHSAHVAVAPKDLDMDEDEPILPAAGVEGILRAHGIDATALSPPQLQLFRAAESGQQRRLVELWRAAPPTSCCVDDKPSLAWSYTSLEKEEGLAQARWEQQQQQSQVQEAVADESVMSLDGTPLTPVQVQVPMQVPQQRQDGRWMVPTAHIYMEPYMASGYEEMARREYEDSVRRAYAKAAVGAGADRGKEALVSATDPVYQTTNSGVDWRTQQQMAMENQYGRMMAFRNDDEEML